MSKYELNISNMRRIDTSQKLKELVGIDGLVVPGPRFFLPDYISTVNGVIYKRAYIISVTENTYALIPLTVENGRYIAKTGYYVFTERYFKKQKLRHRKIHRIFEDGVNTVAELLLYFRIEENDWLTEESIFHADAGELLEHLNIRCKK